ncbi:MAG TPA: sugar transferase [Candidatus Angelobacter sp.]|nr:sugar transferase [Candidatus Angelobacter sp.]
MTPNRGVKEQAEAASSDMDSPVSSWCSSPWKRVCDLAGAVFLLLIFLPLMLIAALGVKLSSPGPVFFRQRRPGRGGREFSIVKFRTMLDGRNTPGPVLTRAADPRVTWLGNYMRKWKVDELPQLWNVLAGEMSFVGPRPQPTRLWQHKSIRRQAACVLSVRPGITSRATVNFRHEEALLGPLRPEEVEEVYTRTIMPLKLNMEIEYLKQATFLGDLAIICRTVLRIFDRRHEDDALVREYLPVVGRRGYPSPHTEPAGYVSAVEKKEYRPAEQTD